MEIRGKVFLVTGGASGLGEATARMIVRRGGQVVIADLDPSGQRIATELGGAAAFVTTDVTQELDGERAVNTARQLFGGLHALVSCAGIAPSERIIGKPRTHTLESFTRVMMVNLVGTFNMLRLAARVIAENEPMTDGERGLIVNTASVAAFEGQIGQVAYAASKGGVASMTLPAARELARSGIRVVTIAPGVFETPMTAGFPQPVRDSLAESIPFPARLGKPEEYAAMVEAICEVVMINGETIRLDGALRMAPK